MECDEALRRMSEAIDRRLAADETARVLEHLEACEACAEVSKLQAQTTAALREHHATVVPPPALRERVLESFGRTLKPRRWIPWARAATLLAALGIGVLVGLAAAPERVQTRTVSAPSDPEAVQKAVRTERANLLPTMAKALEYMYADSTEVTWNGAEPTRIAVTERVLSLEEYCPVIRELIKLKEEFPEKIVVKP